MTANAAPTAKGPLVSELRSGERIVGFYSFDRNNSSPFAIVSEGSTLPLF